MLSSIGLLVRRAKNWHIQLPANASFLSTNGLIMINNFKVKTKKVFYEYNKSICDCAFIFQNFQELISRHRN
jgi:hypothetical protein